MFINDLLVRELADGKKELRLPLIYEYDNGKDFVVPLGFKTDYASIPRLPIVYLLFNGIAPRAATLHDFLYSSPNVSRHTADSLFLRAMLEEGTLKWKAEMAYWAVRVFGGYIRKKTYGISLC